MRKVITGVLVAALFTGLFAGSWFLTGTLSSNEQAPLSPAGSLPEGGTAGTGGADDGVADQTEGDSAEGPAGDVTDGENVVNFPRPKSITDLWTGAEKVFDTLNANPIVRGRALTYATLALYDSSRTNPADLLIVDKLIPARPGDPFLLAGYVLAGVVDNPLLTKAVAAWGSPLPAEARSAGDAYVAMAKADGFDAAGLTSAPTFEGPLAWTTGSRRDGLPEGFEPGFGMVKPILLDIGACPVPAAPVTEIARERQAMGSVPTDTVGPSLPTSESLGATFRLYLQNSTDIVSTPERDRLAAYFWLLTYDAMIATWKAKWENGVAAPVDIASGEIPETRMSYPSYPSWEAVTLSLLETFATEISGKPVTVNSFGEQASASPGTEATAANPLPLNFEAMQRSLAENVFHWDADVAAGRELGSCLARQAVNLAKK